MPHLRRAVSLSSETDWVDAANEHPHMLSYDGVETLGCSFKGTTDVLVATRSAIRAFKPWLGICLLFGLKKKLSEPDVREAEACLLLANIHSTEIRPVMVSLEPGLSHMHLTN